MHRNWGDETFIAKDKSKVEATRADAASTRPSSRSTCAKREWHMLTTFMSRTR